ncbi:MAG: hypothetical protein JWO46_177 [Nocardioidaceae bacterium]|nr:hypothetical protein [Nocardioidaceae bacterium]
MTATPSRSRKPPEVRRQEILDAVVAIAADHGLDAISARDVAERAGVAPGLIHHYFPSMDELLAESFGKWADGQLEHLQRVADDVPPRVSLALTVAHLSPEQRIWNDALSTATRFSELRHRARRLSEAYLAHVQGTIEAGVADGTFVCASPRDSAWRIILILDGMVAMVHILDLIQAREIAAIISPVVEHDLGLEPGSFADLVLAVMARETPGWASQDAVR